MNSEWMKANVVLQIEGGKEYTESEALVELLKIGSQEMKEGKSISHEELKERLKEKVNETI